MDKVSAFLDSFTEWASAQPDLQGVALVGSHARNAARADSDVDLVVLTSQPTSYLQATEWVQKFGVVQKQQVEYYGKVTSLRVWYSDGREVEYGITSEDWATPPLDEGTQRVIADGMRVLFERGTILTGWQG